MDNYALEMEALDHGKGEIGWTYGWVEVDNYALKIETSDHGGGKMGWT